MPSYNPDNPRQMERLREEYDWSRYDLRHARKMYVDVFERYVGDRYTPQPKVPQTYILFTRMAFGIIRRHLVSDNIKTLVRTAVPDLMPAAEMLRLALNDKLFDMRLAHKLKSAVSSAIAKMGVIWCGRDLVSYEGGQTGKPAVDFVDFTQWTHDMWARDIEELNFAGHRVRVSYADALENPLFDHDAIVRMRDTATEQWQGNRDSMDELGGRRSQYDEFNRMFEYDSVWLPKQQMTIGIACEGEPVQVHEPIEWDGPERGPYHVFGYDKVPNQVLPSPPSDAMAYIDDLANSLMRKIAQDSKNAKTVATYRQGHERDAMRVRDANNLDLIAMQDPNGVNQLNFNGVSPQTMGSFLQAKQLFSWANGGLDTLGGLAAGSDTARQDAQLLASAGGMIDDMKSSTITVVADIVKHIAYYLWDDEMWRPDMATHVPNIGYVPVSESGKFEIEMRPPGSLDKLRIDIAPYSSAPITPQSQYQSLSVLTMQVAPALMQLAQQSGGAVDFERGIKRFATLLDVESYVEDVFNILDTTDMPGPESSPTKDNDTTRRYERISSSGNTPEAQDREMMSMMSESPN